MVVRDDHVEHPAADAEEFIAKVVIAAAPKVKRRISKRRGAPAPARGDGSSAARRRLQAVDVRVAPRCGPPIGGVHSVVGNREIIAALHLEVVPRVRAGRCDFLHAAHLLGLRIPEVKHRALRIDERAAVRVDYAPVAPDPVPEVGGKGERAFARAQRAEDRKGRRCGEHRPRGWPRCLVPAAGVGRAELVHQLQPRRDGRHRDLGARRAADFEDRVDGDDRVEEGLIACAYWPHIISVDEAGYLWRGRCVVPRARLVDPDPVLESSSQTHHDACAVEARSGAARDHRA
eukprot:CAMPEP_0180168768 /NCGR_PEP_ID=MMETSP0986-20121125/32860_1 /TAXON_ID=697907 /ORGANISM="non described non described, Strain CCMP2293" /LENGTH=288 /DNA_ID=CAMNT_0022120195 /DNA_START=529 /DNA_END=1395 /DNA_ORIENTATION=+